MSYRDDRDADHARIGALESELAAATQKIDQLEGKRSQALVLAGSATPALAKSAAHRTRWFGAPSKLALKRTFEGTVPHERLEELVELIRARTGEQGRSELMPTSLSWSSENETGAQQLITVRVKDGTTQLELGADLPSARPFVILPMTGAVFGPWLVVVLGAPVVLASTVVLGAVGSLYAVLRRAYKRNAQKQAERLQALDEALSSSIERELAPATPVQQAIASEEALPSTDRDRDKITE